MVEFGVPYAMDGTVIPGVDLRWDTQRKVGVGSGVTDVGDLKVTPLSTPGAGFRVAAGGVLVQCRAAGRTRETYSLSNHTTQNYMGDGGAGIPGTGSGTTRSDMVILEILDPSFAKSFTPQAEWPADQWAKISIVSGVPATATSVDHVPELANVTAYALARVDYPASTATITAAMIKDLRVLQNPQQDEQVITYSLVGDDAEVLTATGANGEVWPNAFTNSAERAVIPKWATQVDVSVSWLGVECLSAAAVTAVWCQIAGNTGAPTVGDNIITQRTTLRGNAMFGVADRRAIPAALRGTTQRVYGMARLVGAVEGANRPKLDANSSMQIRLVWRQVAE